MVHDTEIRFGGSSDFFCAGGVLFPKRRIAATEPLTPLSRIRIASVLSHSLTNDRLRRDRLFRTPRDGIAMSAIRSAFPRQVTVPCVRVPFPTTSSGSAFHVSTVLPPWIASRRFFARRRYPRFPSHSLAVVRGYSEDAYLRARPRPRNLGTRLEWIRITLFWARRRSPTSATTNDA